MKLKISAPSYIYAHARLKEELILKYQYGGPSLYLSSQTAIEESTKAAARWILKGISKLGEAFNTVVTAGGATDFGLTSPFVLMDRQKVHQARMQTVDKAKQTITKAAPVISPSSWVVGLVNGGGPWKGAEIISLADPRLQVVAAGVDLATFAKGPKGVKQIPKTTKRVVNTVQDYRTFGQSPKKVQQSAMEVSLAYAEDAWSQRMKGLSGNNYYHGTGYNPRGPQKARALYGGNKFFASYGEVWPERTRARFLLEFPAQTFGERPLVNKFGINTGYNVLQAYRQMSGMEPLTIPVTLLRNIEKGRNLTTIPSVAFTNALLNSRYKIYYAPSETYPFGALEEHMPRLSSLQSGAMLFYQRPQKISFAEQLGLPKSIRNNLNIDLQQALSDAQLFYQSGQWQNKFLYRDGRYIWDSYVKPGDIPGVTQMIQSGGNAHSSVVRTQLPDGTLSYYPTIGTVGYSARFPKPDALTYSVGEATIRGANSYANMILTSPRTDLLSEAPTLSGIAETLPNRISGNIMKNFWIRTGEITKPGTYISGDAGRLPIGATLISDIKNHKLGQVATDLTGKYDATGGLARSRTGLSVDSYMSILKQGQRPGYELRWGQGFAEFNPSGVDNKPIYDTWKLATDPKFGQTKAVQDIFVLKFNDWVAPFGGRPALVVDGRIIIPHPYLYKTGKTPTTYNFNVEPVKTSPTRTAPATDPLEVRQQRIQNKKDAGIIPETLQTTIINNGEPTAQVEQELISAYRKLGIEEADARAMAKYTIANNNGGSHTPIADDNGNLIGGVSYVDRPKAIEMLRNSGIKNPTESDIKTIIAHEEGHQIETPGSDKEFYTQMGQVLDNEGITAANPNLTLDDMLTSIDRYLEQGRLDNGISARKELILDMPIATANRIMANINRFSGGTGLAYLLSNKKDKINIKNLT